MRRRAALVAALVIALLATAAGTSLAQSVRRDPALAAAEKALVSDDRLAELVLALQADHFEVRPGHLYNVPVLQMACLGELASCNGNNETNPYMVTSLPPVGYPWDQDPPLAFMLRRDEAVVLVGRTPPPMAYFSWRSFVFSRYLPHEGVRRNIFNSLGDPNNMLTMKTQGGPGGDPFDRAYVLVAAADQGVLDRVLAAVGVAGYPGSIVNVDSMSPNLARLGLEAADDAFILLQRLTAPQPGFEGAVRDYIADPPVDVLRLTPNPAVDPAHYRPLPVEKLRPRGTGRTEMDYLPEVEALRRAILDAYPGWHADELTPGVWLEESFPAFQRDVDVLGESRDTVYLRSEGTFTLDGDDFLVVYGANHQATGKATYANFTVYDACKACGVAGEHNRRFAGSALDYVGGSNPAVPHVDQLYAWKVARDCGGDPRCTAVPTQLCEGCPCQVGGSAPLFIGFRAYVEPATMIGPAFPEVIYDRVIRFTRSGPVIAEARVEPELVTADGEPATIVLGVESAEGLDVTWTATLLPDHGCATLEPATGVIAGGNGEVRVTVTAPAGQRALMSVRLEAVDSQGRRATPRTVQPHFYWEDKGQTPARVASPVD